MCIRDSYYLRAQLPDRALEEATRALREDGDRVATLLVMARAPHQKGETTNAVSSLTRAIHLDPDDGSLYMLLHRVCLDAGREEMALDALERLLEELPENWNAQVALGMAYVGTDSGDSGAQPAPPGVFQIVRIHRFLHGLVTLGAFRCNVSLTFVGQLRANRLLLRSFVDEWRSGMVSKPMDSRETSLKKSKKRQAIAPAAI